MSRFLAVEKKMQAAFKLTAPYFSQPARADGIYKKHAYPFCLPVECAHENLFPLIRQTAADYFIRHKIQWHDGQNGKPSNHMCDSQVCCANFLFPFANQPHALAVLLRRVFPTLAEMLPVEDGQFVAFEWIGEQNYLGEKGSRHGVRTRGANFTSADAAVKFRHQDGQVQFVLIEWKYTESYGSTWLRLSKSGTDRTEIYQHLYDQAGCPLNKELLPAFDALFYEPFYQFMRQQFLAQEMEKAHEGGADIVSLLHIAPGHNSDFMRITSPDLRELGMSATGAWQKLVQTPGRFISIHTEDLFGPFLRDASFEMPDWKEYISARYEWVLG